MGFRPEEKLTLCNDRVKDELSFEVYRLHTTLAYNGNKD